MATGYVTGRALDLKEQEIGLNAMAEAERNATNLQVAKLGQKPPDAPQVSTVPPNSMDKMKDLQNQIGNKAMYTPAAGFGTVDTTKAAAPSSPISAPSAPTATTSPVPSPSAPSSTTSIFQSGSSFSDKPMARGGPIAGPGKDGVDNVPALLQNGEYVLPVATVQALGGIEVLDRIVAATNGQPPNPPGQAPQARTGPVPPPEGAQKFKVGGGAAPVLSDDPNQERNVFFPTNPSQGVAQVGSNLGTSLDQRFDAARVAIDSRQHPMNTLGTGLSAAGIAGKMTQQENQIPPRAAVDETKQTVAPVSATKDNWAVRTFDRNTPRTQRAAGEMINNLDRAPSVGTAIHEAGKGAVKVLYGAAKDVVVPVVGGAYRFGKEVLTGQPASNPSRPPNPPPENFQDLSAQNLPSPVSLTPDAVIGKNELITPTNITSQDSQGKSTRVYKNMPHPNSPEAKEFGRAIYSDSFRGATLNGFNEDFAKGGNYVGDPATGKGVSLGDVGNNSPNARYPGRAPNENELNLALQSYAPARENMANAARAQAKTDTMRQYVGKGLSLDQQGAPDDVRDMFNAPRIGETRTQMEFRQNAPAQAAMEHQRALELEALKASASDKQADPNKEPANAAIARYFPENKEAPEQSNRQRAWAGTMATRLNRIGINPPPNQLYAGLALAAASVPDDPNASPAELEARRIALLSQIYGVDLVPLLAQ